jgi:hypothetical protein
MRVFPLLPTVLIFGLLPSGGNAEDGGNPPNPSYPIAGPFRLGNVTAAPFVRPIKGILRSDFD